MDTKEIKEETQEQLNETIERMESGMSEDEALAYITDEEIKKEVKNLLNNPEALAKYVKAHKKANAEAAQRRIMLEKLWKLMGIEPLTKTELDQVMDILDYIFPDGEFDPEHYEEFLAENEDEILEMLESGELEPEDLLLTEDPETGELVPEYELEEEEYIPEEVEEELYEREAQLQELAEKARKAELKVLAIKYGVAPDKVDDFLKLYEEPEVPEGEDAEKAIADSINSYKEKYPVFFTESAIKSTPKKTDHSPIPAPPTPEQKKQITTKEDELESAIESAPTIEGNLI
ncbi:MAG: hypothetical protein DRI01_00670 [Chloroflexi bacterium]|nr:MAG: hypothetical protein DRI01_00670 [Chloroflexota bacterium]